MYVVSIDDAPAVAAVHGERFGEIRPATLVQSRADGPSSREVGGRAPRRAG